MSVPRRDSPVFNDMPLVVLALAATIAAVFLIGTMSPEFDLWARYLGVVITIGIADHPSPLGPWSPFLLHVFLHSGWLHFAFNMGALLAFGTAAARPFGHGWRGQLGFLLFFFASAAGGAAGHILANWGEMAPMVGASTALSGCIAAAGWVRGGRNGMLRLAVPWLLFNLVLAALGTQTMITIAWAGHIGGLVIGAVLYPVFVALFTGRPVDLR